MAVNVIEVSIGHCHLLVWVVNVLVLPLRHAAILLQPEVSPIRV